MSRFLTKELAKDAVLITLGSVLFAVSMVCFLTPANIAPGGLSGLAIIANGLFGFPIGTVTFLLNVPLFFASWRAIGRLFLIKTIYSVALSSLLIDLFSDFKIPPVEPLLAALYGGAIMGFGAGLVLMRSGSSGGTSIMSRLFYCKFKMFSIGQFVLGVDLFVILLSVVAFQDITLGLYAVIAIYISSHVIDIILQGTTNAKLAYIISDHTNEVTNAIVESIQRGPTLLHGQSSYNHQHKHVILCAVRPSELPELKRVVKEVDPAAFIILTNAYEVSGSSFKCSVIQ